eukprot:CAMPEP_0206125026 /NCGR_PEP_ID=MMETSP1472-20131121/15294_1 /ASSEMBLY_ACC=CAM_ASM_001108 /TAXON_ID=41880 /ORGANISM="Pycnococcus provasolii, Strain RCC251" /LENGTH=116 /DNA_ID=CAMNT_0053515887 /DNA_START=141 /DNA_END=488 /DNA_ORIENTATION=+
MCVAHGSVQRLKPFGDRPSSAVTNHASVHLRHRYLPGEGSCHERLVGTVQLREREIALSNRDASLVAQHKNVVPCDAVQLVLSCWRPHFTAAHHKQVGAVARRHESVWIEHDRLIH